MLNSLASQFWLAIQKRGRWGGRHLFTMKTGYWIPDENIVAFINDCRQIANSHALDYHARHTIQKEK